MGILNNSEEIEKVRKRNLWTLFFIGLIYGFCSRPFFLVYQPFILEITGSVFLTGVIVTLGGIFVFFPKPWVGRLSDKFNRKKVWLLEVPLFFMGLMFIFFAENLLYLVPGIIIYFLSQVFGDIGYQMHISESGNDTKKGLLFGLMFFSIFIGNIAGEFFVILGIVKDVRIYFAIYMIINASNYLINVLFISDPKSKHSNNSSNDSKVIDNKHSIWHDIVKTPKKRAVLIFFTLDMFIYSISLTIYGAGLRAQYSLSYEQMAFIAIWISISNMIFLIPGGHLADKIGKKRSLIVSELFGLGYFFTLILAFILWSMGLQQFLIPLLSVGNILLGLNLATFIPSAQMILTDLDETRKAESYGIIDFIRGIGYLPTGIIGGFLIESVSYMTPFVLSFIGIIILIWYLRKNFDSWI